MKGICCCVCIWLRNCKNAHSFFIVILRILISIPHLNSILYFLIYFSADPILIQRFIHSVYGNLDKVKKLIEISFTMRNNYPNVFLKRDPLSPETKQVFEIT